MGSKRELNKEKKTGPTLALVTGLLASRFSICIIKSLSASVKRISPLNVGLSDREQVFLLGQKFLLGATVQTREYSHKSD